MDIAELAEKIKELFHKKPLIFILSALFSFFALAAILISLIQTSPKKTKVPQAQEFKPDSAIIVPSEPQIQKEYWNSRTTEKSWSAGEVEKWFAVPDDKAIEELKKANDAIVSDITGAAP